MKLPELCRGYQKCVPYFSSSHIFDLVSQRGKVVPLFAPIITLENIKVLQHDVSRSEVTEPRGDNIMFQCSFHLFNIQYDVFCFSSNMLGIGSSILNELITIQPMHSQLSFIKL